MKTICKTGAAAVRLVKDLLREEDGVGVVEIILILVGIFILP